MYDHKCLICKRKSQYTLEWYGVDQNGENPEVAGEREVCGRFRHIVEIVEGSENPYGDTPNGIVKNRTGEEQPELLEVLEQAIRIRENGTRRNSRRLIELYRQGQGVIEGKQLPEQQTFWELD